MTDGPTRADRIARAKAAARLMRTQPLRGAVIVAHDAGPYGQRRASCPEQWCTGPRPDGLATALRAASRYRRRTS